VVISQEGIPSRKRRKSETLREFKREGGEISENSNNTPDEAKIWGA